MHLREFFEGWKRVRKNRKNYRIKWVWEFHVADDPFIFYILPAVCYTPWFHMMPDSNWDRMFTFAWLNMAVTVGKLERVKEDNDYA